MTENTSTYGENPTHQSITSKYNSTYGDPSHGPQILQAGEQIYLKEKKYKIISIISEGTGEAIIYKIQDAQCNHLAFKHYFEFSNIKEEPNQEALTRIKSISDPDILLLHDFGLGPEKFQGKYCYEITAFAEG